MLVAGIDGCKGGWIVCLYESRSRRAGWDVSPTIDRAALLTEPCEIVAIDIPIGLPDMGARACDAEARSLVGPRSSSVFPAPTRPMLEADSHERAVAIGRENGGKGLTRQAWNLVPRVRSVDALVRASGQERFVEVHPELCFAMIGGRFMEHPKRRAEGAAEREAVLARHFSSGATNAARRALLASLVAYDDIRDAAISAVTAARIAGGVAGRLPEVPQTDGVGLRMEMWY